MCDENSGEKENSVEAISIFCSVYDVFVLWLLGCCYCCRNVVGDVLEWSRDASRIRIQRRYEKIHHSQRLPGGLVTVHAVVFLPGTP